MQTLRKPAFVWAWTRITHLFEQRLPQEKLVRRLDKHIHKALQSGQRTALIMIEIDRFRIIQSNFSGTELAQIQRTLEDRLKALLGNPKGLRRLGDGRYAYVPTPDEYQIAGQLPRLAKALQTVTKRAVAVQAGHMATSISIGIASDDVITDVSGATLVDAASLALFEATNAGSSAICIYTADMQTRVALRSKLVEDVAPAIDSGAIHAFFQPQIDLHRDKIIGFEALARWKHAERGMISPAEFLPVLAQLGMMRDLGFAILRAALQALHDWDRAGFDVPTVSINMSAEELRNPHLVDAISLELDRFDLTPNRLVIEVLETVVAADQDDIIMRNIRDLSALGCAIDLDDFGTGQASITSIRQFGVDRIKIDRSFVQHVDTDIDQQDMILAMLTMTDRLRVDVLAEGVETPAELAFISDAGCHLVQGYAVSRPMAGADVGRWINERLFHASFTGKQQYIQ
ncbi:bifunctional diguanylate cyclase/phosphodiesterase [Yoonia sp. 208BN28-4]|uniref:bifunctional diguanylate cyclase/phosphodiesterase n=1 Tax=Yoonia sp. 208BN28-4 TaxID=3126505 RepID=UPI00309BEAF9